MEENLFKNAKLGDKFKMRNGKMAIYCMKVSLYTGNSHMLSSKEDSYPFNVDDNGKASHIKRDHDFDIISKWDDSIDDR